MNRFLALVLLFACGAAHASEAEVTKLMEDYWRAYSRSEFLEAAGYLDPRDLEALRSGLLPMFIEASDSKHVSVAPLVKTFFGKTPPDKRKEMTSAQVFAGMNLMLKDVMPAVYSALRRTSIAVTRVQLADDGSAVVQYTVKTPDGDAADADRANLHEGRWYLRTKEAPAATVEKFRMLLGLAIETGPEVKLSPPAEDAPPR
jgi:hypothetical protein